MAPMSKSLDAGVYGFESPSAEKKEEKRKEKRREGEIYQYGVDEAVEYRALLCVKIIDITDKVTGIT